MGIPKIKIYRLDEGYSPNNDNDIQSIVSDEMIPLQMKNLQPNLSDEMVGVKERSDARLVVESDWKFKFVSSDETSKNDDGSISLSQYCCDDWVMGKGNFRILLHFHDSSSSSSESTLPSSELSLSDFGVDNYWFQLDRKFWSYTTKVTKTLYNKSVPYFYYDSDMINFKLSNLITINGEIEEHVLSILFPNLPTLFKNNSITIKNLRIDSMVVMYKTFEEFYNYISSSSSLNITELPEIYQNTHALACNKNTEIQRGIMYENSKFRVPFGEIYNGNKNGRCFGRLQKTEDGSSYVVKDVKSLVPYGNRANNYMQFFQGNYNYKRKIYPLKCIKKSLNGNVVSFKCNENWIFEDVAKPVLMQLIPVSEGEDIKYIFKSLSSQQCQSNSLSYDNDNLYISYTLLADYYFDQTENSYNYPSQVYLFYNERTDSMGNVFDFNYDYHAYLKECLGLTDTSLLIEPWSNYKDLISFSSSEQNETNNMHSFYGYENRGNVICNDVDKKFMFENAKSIYLKKQKLATLSNNIGRQDDDLNLNSQGTIITISGFSECTRLDLGVRIYNNGDLIYDSKSSSSSSQGFTDIKVNLEDDNITMTSLSEISMAQDFMVVFYEEYKINNIEDENESSSSSNDGEYLILGYRIPCYEKVKSTKLFVSSFPNWTKGHLNNDLDVFYGNKQYSGLTVTNSVLGAFYPAYQEDGWKADYSKGSIEFTEKKDEIDYFDILFFHNNLLKLYNGAGEEISSSSFKTQYVNAIAPNNIDQNLLQIAPNIIIPQYTKVKYNVGHYDGVFNLDNCRLSNYTIQNGIVKYALLEDEDYLEYKDCKWLIRQDSVFRKTVESGRDILPLIGGFDDYEEATRVLEVECKEGDYCQINTNTDRVNYLHFILNYSESNSGAMILCLGKNYEETKCTSNEDEIKNAQVFVFVRINSKEDTNEKQKIQISSITKTDLETKIKNIDYNKFNEIYESVKSTLTWEDLEDLNNVYELKDGISFQNFFSNDQSSKIIKNIKISNDGWSYYVYIQIFAYRYGEKVKGKPAVSSVEYVVYRVNK